MILVKAVLECRPRPAFIERDKVPIIFIFVTIEFAHASDFVEHCVIKERELSHDP